MMRRRLLALGLAASLLLVSHPSDAVQNSRTATGTAKTRIITAISIVKILDLRFADVVPGAALGTVVMTPAGVRTSTGGTRLGNGAAAGPASFQVTGQASATYAIVLPNLVTVSNGAQTMRVNTFRSSPATPGNLGGGGAQTLGVGATCHVAANQAIGTYIANFTVTVSYN